MAFVSIVIPIYNRARLVGRTLHSVLQQRFSDFEIVAVDDASTDHSVHVVRDFKDPRLRLLCHDRNQGVCPARNTGIAVARGQWVLCLDSDDELLPGALETLYRRAQEAGPSISIVRFMCQWDTGIQSPDPPFTTQVLDYVAYLHYLETMLDRPAEDLTCVRRETFDQVKYPPYRGGTERLYHLNCARLFLSQTFPDIIRLYHHDADNQLTVAQSERDLRDASYLRSAIQEVLALHGDSLRRHAPRQYMEHIRALATSHFLCGDRWRGLSATSRYLMLRPWHLKAWAVALGGLLGPKSLAWMKERQPRHRATAGVRGSSS